MFSIYGQSPIILLTYGGSTTEVFKKYAHDPWGKKNGIKFLYRYDAHQSFSLFTMAHEIDKSFVDLFEFAGPFEFYRMYESNLLYGFDHDELKDFPAVSENCLFYPAFNTTNTEKCYGVISLEAYELLAYKKILLKENKPFKSLYFFDTKTFPGVRAAPKNLSSGFLEWVLFVHGHDAKDIYTILATDEGLDFVFDQLRPMMKDIIFYETYEQAVDLMNSGEIIMSFMPAGRIYRARNHLASDIGLDWSHHVVETLLWTVPNHISTEKKKQILEYISFVFTMPNVVDFMLERGVASTNPKINRDLRAYKNAHLFLPPMYGSSGIKLDSSFWSEHADRIERKCQAFLASYR